jgi:protein farnesyltransferase subunit beta
VDFSCIMVVRRMLGSHHLLKDVCTDGRSAYCAVGIATLLNLRTEELVKGTREWCTSCQTFEGGIAGSPTSAEAHGGYAFCVLAALCLLSPPSELGNHLDLDNLIVPHTM